MNLDEAILSHLSRSAFAEQAELLALLQSEGFDLTLSTLSRHMKKLNIRKEEGRYRRARTAASLTHPYTLQKVPPQLLILKTTPGFAQAMALALDGAALMKLAGRPGGPWLGELQRRLLEAVLDKPEINTAERLSERALRLLLDL